MHRSHVHGVNLAVKESGLCDGLFLEVSQALQNSTKSP